MYPLSPLVSMAKTKTKLFKQISNVHLEDVAQNNDWSSFLKLEKQNSSMRSAYIDKIRISWVLESEHNDSVGCLFIASHDNALDSTTPANNDGNVIAATASRGAGGVVTLDIKRRITIDYDGASADTLQLLQGTSGAPVYCHLMTTDIDATVGVYLVVETWGRWFSATSL